MYDEIAVENDPFRGCLVLVGDDEIYDHMHIEEYAEVAEYQFQLTRDAWGK